MNKRTDLTLAAVLLMVGSNIGCDTQVSRKPVEVQNRLLQKLRTMSSDWDNVLVTESDKPNPQERTLYFFASFRRDGERYTMNAGERKDPPRIYSVDLTLGDVDILNDVTKSSRDFTVGEYRESDKTGRLEVDRSYSTMPQWDEAKLKRFLPLAEQFRQAILDVL